MRTIHPATSSDMTDVLRLLNDAAAWLHSRGIDQWPNGFDAPRISPMIERGEVYLVCQHHEAIATVTASSEGDPEFWTPSELAEPALYIAKLAIDREQAGSGVGALLLRWTVDLAARRGAQWARLDAWRTNRELHDYYRRAGWAYLRTVELPHRRSGALFQRPATSDLAARAAFN